MFLLFCARIDLLFIIFICSLYSLWATIRLLHHFGFVCVLILGYHVNIFRAIDTKYVSCRLAQFSKRQRSQPLIKNVCNGKDPNTVKATSGQCRTRRAGRRWCTTAICMGHVVVAMEKLLHKPTSNDALFVDVCINFSLKALDLVTMKKLDSKVNIIPVIAKADTITKTELNKFKAKVNCLTVHSSRNTNSCPSGLPWMQKWLLPLLRVQSCPRLSLSSLE